MHRFELRDFPCGVGPHDAVYVHMQHAFFSCDETQRCENTHTRDATHERLRWPIMAMQYHAGLMLGLKITSLHQTCTPNLAGYSRLASSARACIFCHQLQASTFYRAERITASLMIIQRRKTLPFFSFGWAEPTADCPVQLPSLRHA